MIRDDLRRSGALPAVISLSPVEICRGSSQVTLRPDEASVVPPSEIARSGIRGVGTLFAQLLWHNKNNGTESLRRLVFDRQRLSILENG